MSQQNVEIVRRAVEAYLRGADPAEVLDPHVIWNPADEAAVEGPDEVRAYMERWEGEWEGLETLAEDFIDAGDRVLVTMRFSGRGRMSGADVEALLYEVYTVREGRITRMDEFTEREEALAAAGLRE